MVIQVDEDVRIDKLKKIMDGIDLTSSDSLSIDFSQVKKIDGAGMQFIVAFLSQKERFGDLTIVDPPKAIFDFLKQYGY